MRLLDMTACVHLLMELVVSLHGSSWTWTWFYYDIHILGPTDLCVSVYTVSGHHPPHTDHSAAGRWVYATQLWCVFKQIGHLVTPLWQMKEIVVCIQQIGCVVTPQWQPNTWMRAHNEQTSQLPADIHTHWNCPAQWVNQLTSKHTSLVFQWRHHQIPFCPILL